MPSVWQTLRRETILDHSKFLRVEEHTVKLPDGKIIDNWSYVITPNVLSICALTTENQFICFRQNKYSIDGISLAPVSGYIEPGEDPLSAAQRELLEETGYRAKNWSLLGDYAVDGNRGVARAFAVLATDAERICEPNADDYEQMEMVLLSHSEVMSALKGGDFKVLLWATAMALGMLHLPSP